ncbi:MAG TPA: MinD/ParA family protein [Herpetosiphonaceae bacterium]|nr:MinD/ParA family protein [Herpetosiphonaceae bacterium]
MAKIISVHSFRGGTGKSNTTANIASLIATRGQRVGVVDTDIQSPGIHILFGLDEDTMEHSLNDYLYGKCEIKDAAYDVTPLLGVPISGKVFLAPASVKSGEIIQFLKEGYDPGVLNEGFQQLIEDLALDVLMIDTHPGLNEETLLSIAISDELVIILRPDQQDYQGTGVTVEIARKLDVPELLLLVNKVPSSLDPERLKARVEQIYDSEVAGVVPHSDEMMALASAGIFALRFPDHPITVKLKEVANRLMM